MTLRCNQFADHKSENEDKNEAGFMLRQIMAVMACQVCLCYLESTMVIQAKKKNFCLEEVLQHLYNSSASRAYHHVTIQ